MYHSTYHNDTIPCVLGIQNNKNKNGHGSCYGSFSEDTKQLEDVSERKIAKLIDINFHSVIYVVNLLCILFVYTFNGEHRELYNNMGMQHTVGSD